MKKIVISLISLVLVTSCSLLKKNKSVVNNKQSVELKTSLDSLSFFLGSDIGHNLQQEGIEFDPQMVFKGLEAAKAGTDTLTLTKERKDAIMQKLQQDMRKKQEAEMKKQEAESAVKSEPTKKAGATFLAENKKKEGVIELPSGLQYKVIKEGAGEHPKATDKVKVHYHGTLIDGTVFDSSVQRGEPISFPLNQVIKGWTEGVQLMTPGSKYVFYIPYNLAYGEKDAGGGKIPGGSTLIFEVELFSIEK